MSTPQRKPYQRAGTQGNRPALRPSIAFVSRVMLRLYSETALKLREIGEPWGMCKEGVYAAVQRAKIQNSDQGEA